MQLRHPAEVEEGKNLRNGDTKGGPEKDDFSPRQANYLAVMTPCLFTMAGW